MKNVSCYLAETNWLYIVIVTEICNRGAAFKIPPNGITPHSTINVSDKAVKLVWMMKLAD